MVAGGQELAERALCLCSELGGGDNEEKTVVTPDLKTVPEARAVAQRFFEEGQFAQAALAASQALSGMLRAGVWAHLLSSSEGGTKHDAPRVTHTGPRVALVKRKVHAVLHVAKDTASLFRGQGGRSRATAQQVLAAIHLCRFNEPDAPMAALRTVKEALRLFRDLQDAAGEAFTLRTAMDAHMFRAAMTPFPEVRKEAMMKAVEMAEETVRLRQQQGDKRMEAVALINASVALQGFNDDGDAITNALQAELFSEQAVELSREIGDKELESHALGTIMAARLNSNDVEEALELAKEAAARFRDPEHPNVMEVGALHSAASLHLVQGDVEDALRFARLALARAEDIGDKREAAAVLHTLVEVRREEGKTDEALKAAQQIVDIFRGLEDKQGEAAALLSLARLRFGNIFQQVEKECREEEQGDRASLLREEDIGDRGHEVMQTAADALSVYSELDDQAGVQAVRDMVKDFWDQSVNLYCEVQDPTTVKVKLDEDGKKEVERIHEWVIEFPEHEKRKRRQLQADANGFVLFN